MCVSSRRVNKIFPLKYGTSNFGSKGDIKFWESGVKLFNKNLTLHIKMSLLHYQDLM
jgi:hypothetical protein